VIVNGTLADAADAKQDIFETIRNTPLLRGIWATPVLMANTKRTVDEQNKADTIAFIRCLGLGAGA
jgi:hypothetical protein